MTTITGPIQRYLDALGEDLDSPAVDAIVDGRLPIADRPEADESVREDVWYSEPSMLIGLDSSSLVRSITFPDPRDPDISRLIDGVDLSGSALQVAASLGVVAEDGEIVLAPRDDAQIRLVIDGETVDSLALVRLSDPR